MVSVRKLACYLTVLHAPTYVYMTSAKIMKLINKFISLLGKYAYSALVVLVLAVRCLVTSNSYYRPNLKYQRGTKKRGSSRWYTLVLQII